MRYQLPRAPIFNREAYILHQAKGKKVLHLGAAQASDDHNLEKFDKYVSSDSFLHRLLTNEGELCVGIDYNRKFVNLLKERHGYQNIYVGDLEDSSSLPEINEQFDILIMGELIEHLPNPLKVLRNLTTYMKDDSRLYVTTPNALAVKNTLFNLAGFESHDEDHVAIYTPRLLHKILSKAALEVVESVYYQSTYGADNTFFKNYCPRSHGSINGFVNSIITNIALRLRPSFADGLIAVVVKSDDYKK